MKNKENLIQIFHTQTQEIPSLTQDFSYFTKNNIQSFNNENIQKVINNRKNQNTNTNKIQIHEFLRYFSNDYLKIGNRFVQKLEGHTQTVKDVLFWNQGNSIISASNDSLIKQSNQKRIWNIDGYKIKHTFQSHTQKVLSLSLFHPYLVSGSTDQSIILYNLNTLQAIHRFLGHKSKVNSVRFSKSGQYIASASEDYSIKIWDVETKEIIQDWKKHKDGVLCVDWNIDDSLVISSSHDKNIRIWDFQSGDQIYSFKGSLDGIYRVKFSPCGKFFAFTNIKSIQLWNIRSRKCHGVFTGHGHIVRSIAFSPDGNYLSSSGEDNQIRIWNVSTQQCEAVLEDDTIETDGITSIAYSENGQYLVSGDYASQVVLWKTSQFLQTYSVSKDEIYCVAYSLDGSMFATAGIDNLIKIWHVQEGIQISELRGHEHSVTALIFFDQDKYMLSSSDDKNIILWDILGQTLLKTFAGHRHNVSAIVMSPCEKFFASGSIDKTIKIWDIESHSLLSTLQGHREGISALCWLTEQNMVISASFDNTIIIWDLQSNSIKNQIYGHSAAINSICLAKKQTIIFSASNDHTVRGWDVANGTSIVQFNCHTDKVQALCYCESLNLLCSVADDSTLWQINKNSVYNCNTMTLQCLIPHQFNIQSLDYSPKGTHLLCGLINGSILIYSTQTLNNYISLQRTISTVPLITQHPKILKSKLPLQMTPLHYALYMNNLDLFEEIIKFCIQHGIYIDQKEDLFGNSILSLGKKNRMALQMILEYYTNEGVKEDGGYGGRDGEVFSEFLNLLIKERIPGLCEFLDSRSFKPQGDKPRFSEYFPGIRTISINNTIPTSQNYQSFLPHTQIQNKSSIQFRIYDLPFILDIPQKYMFELSQLPDNSIIFQTQFINDLLQYKWDNYARQNILLKIILLQRITNIPFYYFIIFYSNNQFFIEVIYLKRLPLVCIIAGLITFQYSILKSHQPFDLFINILIMVCISLDYIFGKTAVVVAIESFSVIPIWIKLLYYVQGSRRMGFLLRLLIQVIKDVYPSIIILFILVSMFSMMSFILQDFVDGDQTFYQRFILTYTCLFQTFDETYVNTQSPSQFIIFMFLTMTLMVLFQSFIISIIQETKDRVLGQEIIERNYQRLLFIYNLESKLPQSQILKINNQKYLLVGECVEEENQNPLQFRQHIQNMFSKVDSKKYNLTECPELDDFEIPDQETVQLQGREIQISKRLNEIWEAQQQLEKNIWNFRQEMKNQ